jgi:hypothetical protein
LFNHGKISRDFAAVEFYNVDQDFSKFTLDVFRHHFNTTKAKGGIVRKFFSIARFDISY